MILLLALGLALAQAVAPPSGNQSPAQVTPAGRSGSSQFTAEAGLLLVTIKPAAIADYELVIRTLQEALAKDTDPQRKAAAKGWRVFKAAEADPKGNPIYVHVTVAGGAELRLSPVALDRRAGQGPRPRPADEVPGCVCRAADEAQSRASSPRCRLPRLKSRNPADVRTRDSRQRRSVDRSSESARPAAGKSDSRPARGAGPVTGSSRRHQC